MERLCSCAVDEIRVPEGLRERKREATRLRIEQAALDLCAEHGYGRVTVAQICRRSGVAQSTFFNYFSTKDTAILGEPPTAAERDIEEFLTGAEPLLEALVRLLVRTADAAATASPLSARRLQLIFETPPLRLREAARLEADAEKLVDLASRREGVTFPNADPAAIRHRAVVAVSVATALLRQMLVEAEQTATADWQYIGARALATVRSLVRETGRSGRQPLRTRAETARRGVGTHRSFLA